MEVYPNYYDKFSCINSSCHHNCCIGWEIDIDDETHAYYSSLDGDIGKKLKDSICVSQSGETYFNLSENGRCPFLDSENLCEIIKSLGEDGLCQICADHPRFINCIDDREEIGLGMCCEAAALLILSQKERFELLPEYDGKNEILLARDEVINEIQDSPNSSQEIAQHLASKFKLSFSKAEIKKSIEFLITLESLDTNWTSLLKELSEHFDELDFEAFGEYIEKRDREYKNLLTYFAYRHLSVSSDFCEFSARMGFVLLGYYVLYSLGALILKRDASLPISISSELARMYSAEIEYSEENTDLIIKKFMY